MGHPPLRAQDFMANNPEHLELLRRMGVSLIHLKDGRVQLVQHATQVNKSATGESKIITLLGEGVILPTVVMDGYGLIVISYFICYLSS